MSIVLPDLVKSDCRLLTVCGKPAEGRHAANEGTVKVAEYSVPPGTYLLRVRTGSGSDHDHLHVDCAAKDYFPVGHSPAPTASIDEAIALLDKFKGQDAAFGVTAEFRISWDMLTDEGIAGFIRSNIDSKDTAVLRMTAGEYLLRNLPAYRITWRLHDAPQQCDIVLQAMMKSSVGEQYLVEAFTFVSKLFSMIVLGRLDDGTQQTA